ncbi:MAG: HAMP domain-containing protein [Paenibacillaceae bacterium]|nr:HAMP domain-containing protein [Paenibacillaceae bacterium]
MSVTRWTGLLFRVPIKFKLTLWSTVLIMVLLIGNYALQYIVMDKWIIHREKSGVQRTMNGILNDLLEREAAFTPDRIKEIKLYLEKANRDDQMIRIVGSDGVPLVTVANDVTESGIIPRFVSQQQIELYRIDDNPVLLMRSPLTIFEFAGTVEIVKSLAAYEQLLHTIMQVMLAFAAGAVVFSVLVGWLIARKLLKPLQAMAQTIRDVNSKGIQERMIPAHNGDELSTLMILFNDMMDKVEESFWQQGRFVEDASHELRTPIAIIEGHLSLLHRWGKDDAEVLNSSLHASLQEFGRLKQLVTELLTLTRAEKEAGDPDALLTRPDEAVRAMTERFMSLHPGFAVTFDLDELAGAELLVSAPHLEQLLHIILDNAVKYSSREKTIVVRAGQLERKAFIVVEDRGIGIPAGDLPYVTERFYRVDKARSRDLGGNGLGLAIAKRLVERYEGKLTIQSREHRGTAVTIYLLRSADGRRLGETLS